MLDMSKRKVDDIVISRNNSIGKIVKINNNGGWPYEIEYEGVNFLVYVDINGLRFDKDEHSIYDIMSVKKERSLNQLLKVDDLKNGMRVCGNVRVYSCPCDFDDAMICIEGTSIYLLNNVADGKNCSNKHGYKYSWCISDAYGTNELLKDSYFQGEIYIEQEAYNIEIIINTMLAEINKITSETIELLKLLKKETHK